jgi:hypothetical protein
MSDNNVSPAATHRPLGTAATATGHIAVVSECGRRRLTDGITTTRIELADAERDAGRREQLGLRGGRLW